MTIGGAGGSVGFGIVPQLNNVGSTDGAGGAGNTHSKYVGPGVGANVGFLCGGAVCLNFYSFNILREVFSLEDACKHT